MPTAPAQAAQDGCKNYLNAYATARICVEYGGSLRGVNLGVNSVQDSTIAVEASSVYLRQCDGYGRNCVQTQASPWSTGGQVPAPAFFQRSSTAYSYGHTYIACASFTTRAPSGRTTTFTNICSDFRVN